MSEAKTISMDGNAAASYSAHAMSEVIAIYPITPSSPMAELADEYSAKNRKNIFGQVPTVYEMQSEGGAVAAIHGAMSAGTLTTTFTASQGLLLMIPSMYKIAGELLPTVFNVSARTLSSHALSIFGDHSDVMACRQTGFSMLASANQQEVMDQAAIAMAIAIKSSLPFIQFFDGFRTSHEIAKVETLTDETMRALVDMDALEKFRMRSLNPDRPTLKGTAMNPDLWFQGAEAKNPFYDALFQDTLAIFKQFGELTGRTYQPFEYHGDKNAETVFVLMGSGAEVAEETVDFLNEKRNMKTGVLRVRLVRPFNAESFLAALPKSAQRIAVLDRTKEPGSLGEPLYLDVIAALSGANRLGELETMPKVIGGRYGLSSKDFTPSHVKAIVDHMDETDPAKWIHGFTVGIEDDVSKRSLPVKEEIDTEREGVHRLKFWGLGSDGTVGANKNSIKIIGDNTDMHVQGHFVYDSKKAGGTTISHLRFSKDPIKSHYLINEPDFVAIHNREFLGKYDLLAGLQKGGYVLINTPLSKDEVFQSFPKREQQIMIDKEAKLYAIDANKVVAELGMPGRINTTMQAAFFRITDIMEKEKVFEAVENAIKKTYGKKGEKVVQINVSAFKLGWDSAVEIPIPDAVADKAGSEMPKITPKSGDEHMADMLTKVIDPVTRLEGDKVPVSLVPIDGSFPTATTCYEKRSIATHVPNWDSDLCVQCARCSFVCPHAAIRVKVSNADDIQLSAEEYPTIQLKGKDATEKDRFRVQVFPDDCTGCGVCIQTCLGKDKETGRHAIELTPKYDVLEALRKSEKEYLRLPESDKKFRGNKTLKSSQLTETLFEFSGACPGCGETPYVKLATQLAGDHMIISNATGCSSIYGGTAPTVPYTKNADGRGPAWVSSLFEDNAEHGLGIYLGVEYLQNHAFSLRSELLNNPDTDDNLKRRLKEIDPIETQVTNRESFEKSLAAMEEVTKLVKDAKEGTTEHELSKVVGYLADKAVLIVGGDGWAYDIGYGGLDHVLASGKNVTILVMDTEVYSNTGGQRSKATFLGGVAKFAAAGKETNKKDMGLMAMTYRNVYVGSTSFGADPNHTLKVMREALEYPGVSLILAYSTCIEHGIRMNKGPEFSKLAVESGYWVNYRYDPRLLAKGKNPLQIDSKEPTKPLKDFLMGERRFARLADERPERAEAMFTEGERFVKNRWNYYQSLAKMNYDEWELSE